MINFKKVFLLDLICWILLISIAVIFDWSWITTFFVIFAFGCAEYFFLKNKVFSKKIKKMIKR